MKIIRKLRNIKAIPEVKLLEMWPPYLFMGVKVVSVSENFRSLHIKLPRRFYSTNMYGSMFGGFICAVSDPLPALLVEKQFPGSQAWTKRNCVDFLKPGNGDLEVRIEITDQDIEEIQKSMEEKGSATHTFNFQFTDKRDRIVAECQNIVFVRNRTKNGN